MGLAKICTEVSYILIFFLYHEFYSTNIVIAVSYNLFFLVVVTAQENENTTLKELYTERVLNFIEFGPADLTAWILKMTYIKIQGAFSPEQITAASSLPGVRVYGRFVTTIEKIHDGPTSEETGNQ